MVLSSSSCQPQRPHASELAIVLPEQEAKSYIERRPKSSVVPGNAKLTFTLDIPHELAERLSARAISEGRNLEAVVMEMLEAASA
jgi:hypothetical protein